MASTFTPNIQLEEPARGDDVGTWDVPVNNNMTLIDSVVGGTATIPLTNASVTLSAAQFQCNCIIFTGALSAALGINFPSSFAKGYTIQNLCTGTASFQISLRAAGGGAQVACPPGEAFDIISDGSNVKFRNLGRVGEYMDYAGSAVPVWIVNSVPPPYLNCDGSAFSAATYPVLASILGGTNLPDLRGVSRATLNQGTNRITAASGINGDVRFAIGGSQFAQQHQHTGNTGNDAPDHSHNFSGSQANGGTYALNAGAFSGWGALAQVTAGANARHAHPFTTDLALNGGSQNMPPTTISGITMIRAG